MFPMSIYSGKILLQTTPSHIIGQLDKCIREASTLDGVLEFRHEHFWTVAFGMMAGSVHVRVRRDADEQMVLAHVYHRLANLVSVLTVQIFKDDWSRPSSFQILGDTALLSKSGSEVSIGGRPMMASPPSSIPAVAATVLPYPNYGPSYRTLNPTASSDVGSFVTGGHTGSGSVGFANHAGVRFPPIPHYTDVSTSGGYSRLGPAVAMPGFSSSSVLPGTSAASKDQGDKYK
jgi:zinc transporter 6